MKGYLDTRRLLYFRAVVASGSISAGARALNIAQPALSYHMAELENLLGEKVFHRRHDGVELTEAGTLLNRHAAAIAEKVDEAEADLERFVGARGAVKLRLAVIASLAAELTPALLEALAREMPGIATRISEADTLRSRRLLDDGEVDAAIYLTAAREAGAEQIASERLFFISTGGDGGRASPIRFADIARHKLVLPALGNPLRMFVERSAAEAGHMLDVGLEVDGMASRRMAVLAGLGATILGAHSVLNAPDEPRLNARPIIEPELHRPICFAVRPDFDPALAARLRAVVAATVAGAGFALATSDDVDVTES